MENLKGKLNFFKKGLVLRLTSLCNHNCLFCTQKKFINNIDYKKFLNFSDKQLNDILDIYKKDLYDFLLISGGEATLNLDLIKIIKFFQKNNIFIVLMTNGSLLHKLDFTGINKNNILIYISYHGFEDTFELLINKNNQENLELKTKKETEFEIVSKNIKSFIDKGFNIILKIVINKYNISSTKLFVEYIFNRFGNKILIDITLMEGLSNKKVRDLACDIKQFNHIVIELFKLYGKNIIAEGIKVCDNDFFIQHHKNLVSPLSTKIIGDIRIEENGQIFYETKNKSGKFNIKRYLSKCKNCKYYNDCLGYDIYYLKK